MAIYESEGSEPQSGLVGEICKTPPRRFGVEMQIADVYDKGFTVSCKVDGILCLSQADAMKCFEHRIAELFRKWEEAKAKL